MLQFFAKLFNIENEIAIFLDVLTRDFLSPDLNEGICL